MQRQRAPQTRYALLTSALKQQIEQGKYPVGEVLPTEATLCEQFNVSRHTVREALRELRRLGLIASKQGSGSVVMAKSAAIKYTHTVNSLEDLMGMHHEASRKIISSTIEPLEPALAKANNLSNKQLWVRLEILHSVPKSASPIMHSIAYIDAKYSEIQTRYNVKNVLMEQLQAFYGVNIIKVKQTIQAVALNKKESQSLKTKAGEPALKATRYYYGQDHSLIYISVNVSPADRYIYTTDFQLSAEF